MEPVQVAGHVSLSVLHNDVYMEGVYKSGSGTAVQVYLRGANPYGISLVTSDYNGDRLPLVAPIRRDSSEELGFAYEWDRHPDFVDIRDSERGCTVERAVEILTHLRDNA